VKKGYSKYYGIFLTSFLLSLGADLFILTFYLSFNIYHGMDKEISIKQRDRLILHKDGKRVAVFNILVRDPIPFGLEGGS
jgi:hypothetical protein